MHRYEAIRAELLDRIRNNVWPPGFTVPREEDLADEFGVARGTVRRALASLVAAGLLERRKRAGTRVVEPTSHQSTLKIPIIRHEIETQGRDYGYRRLSAAEGADVRDEHELFSGAALRHVVCLHLGDGKPYQLENRLINVDLVPEALDEAFTEISPNEWLLAQAPYSSVRTTMRAAAAGADVATLLSLPEGAPVFVIERITRLDGIPVTHVVMTYPGSQFELVTETDDLRWTRNISAVLAR
ncbi:MAG: GntR family transcriptional regulator [Pseudomonadota bacterium]